MITFEQAAPVIVILSFLLSFINLSILHALIRETRDLSAKYQAWEEFHARIYGLAERILNLENHVYGGNHETLS